MKLPFDIDPSYDYILTEEDRKRFAPLQVTDECWPIPEGGWRVTKAAPDDGFADYVYYRRRKVSSWVKVSDGSLPEVGKAIWVCFQDNSIGYWRCGFEDLTTSTATHWRYCEGDYQVPPPPQPPKSAADVAEDKFWEWYQREGKRMDHDSCALKAFHIALELTKENKDTL